MGTSQEYRYMTRRIGSTTYKVKVAFSGEAEPMEDKILRIIRNEILTAEEKYGNIEVPQMSRQSERSA